MGSAALPLRYGVDILMHRVLIPQLLIIIQRESNFKELAYSNRRWSLDFSISWDTCPGTTTLSVAGVVIDGTGCNSCIEWVSRFLHV